MSIEHIPGWAVVAIAALIVTFPVALAAIVKGVRERRLRRMLKDAAIAMEETRRRVDQLMLDAARLEGRLDRLDQDVKELIRSWREFREAYDEIKSRFGDSASAAYAKLGLNPEQLMSLTPEDALRILRKRYVDLAVSMHSDRTGDRPGDPTQFNEGDLALAEITAAYTTARDDLARRRAEESPAAPAWFGPWVQEVARRRMEGLTFIQAATEAAESKELFPADEPQSERVQRWFFIDEEREAVRICWRDEQAGWIRWSVHPSQDSAHVVISGPDAWSDEEREVFERRFVAKTVGHLEIMVFPKDFSFESTGYLLGETELSPAGQEAANQLQNIASELAPTADVHAAINYSRVISRKMQDNVAIDLATKPRRLARIQHLLSLVTQLSYEAMTRLTRELAELSAYCDAMAMLANGEKPGVVFAARIALDWLQSGLQEYISSAWRSMTLHWDLPEEVRESLLKGSPVFLVLLLEILIFNAMHQFGSQSDEQKPEVIIKAMRQGQEIVVIVRDTGPGEDDPRSWSHPQLGFGDEWGRGIVRSAIRFLAQALGASVEVLSPKGEGTTVTVRLPIAPAGPAFEGMDRVDDIVQQNVANMFSEKFNDALSLESIGGNAGAAHSALNFLFKSDGTIVEFGNFQELDDQIRRRRMTGELLSGTFLIHFPSDHIDQLILPDNCPIPAKQRLEQTVLDANQKHQKTLHEHARASIPQTIPVATPAGPARASRDATRRSS
jgi:signal transduction histidine kinase